MTSWKYGMTSPSRTRIDTCIPCKRIAFAATKVVSGLRVVAEISCSPPHYFGEAAVLWRM